MKNDSPKLQLTSLTIFSIAMGFLEAAVVVYLRSLFYPEGFTFPLTLMTPNILFTEYLREISTLVMLVSLSLFGGRNTSEKLSIFLFSFGVWDIFYYVWLKVLLDWPPSLFTYDILFLIPVIWIAPVLAPIICSLTMIGIAGCITYASQKNYRIVIRLRHYISFFVGVLVIFISFIWDFAEMIVGGGFLSRFWTLPADPAFQRILEEYIPVSFPWPLFITGELLILITSLSLCREILNKSKLKGNNNS